MFEWVKSNISSHLVTLYKTNITLNSVSASYFSDARWCLLGIDEDEKKLAVKPLSKREVDLKVYPEDQLHKISLGKGYARISNKTIMDKISNLLKIDCDGIKFEAAYNNKEKMLIVDLSRKV